MKTIISNIISNIKPHNVQSLTCSYLIVTTIVWNRWFVWTTRLRSTVLNLSKSLSVIDQSVTQLHHNRLMCLLNKMQILKLHKKHTEWETLDKEPRLCSIRSSLCHCDAQPCFNPWHREKGNSNACFSLYIIICVSRKLSSPNTSSKNVIWLSHILFLNILKVSFKYDVKDIFHLFKKILKFLQENISPRCFGVINMCL